jgi:hypothetical protein
MSFFSHLRRWTFSLGLLALVSTLAWSQGTYTTKFPATENPISEGGHWINGKAVGLDWQNVRTTPGLAFGTQTGSSGQYDDSTAVLSGTWGLNQTVQATAYVTNAPVGVGSEEVELRLRSTVTAHNNTGYEINFSTSKGLSSSSYMQFVRWNGPLGNFTVLKTYTGSQYGVSNGDVVKATIVGTSPATITAYVNGTQMGQATDSVGFTSGSPGMGFWLKVLTNATEYGFTNFTATDGSSSPPSSGPPAPPTNLTAVVH